jgi:hypothetical protein
MSQFLTGLAQLNPQVKRHNGGTSTLTLDQNGTTKWKTAIAKVKTDNSKPD